MITIDNMPTEYSKVFEFKLKSFSLWMGVRYVSSFSANLIFIFIELKFIILHYSDG